MSRANSSISQYSLAYMEIFMALGNIFRKLQFKLYETDLSDVEMVYDFFLPSPRFDSKGVRVKVVEIEE
jgi:hypothetical protein